MFGLRRCILSHLLSSPSTSPISSLRGLLSATAPSVSPPNSAFAVEDYLVATCGLTRAQSIKASTKLSHLKSPSKPDAVLAFLAGLGLSSAQVAALVAKDPRFLCAGVERTLAPNAVKLSGLGLSHSEIARLVSLALDSFRYRSISSKLQYYVPLFGSLENFFRALEHNYRFLCANLDKAANPNVALLRECTPEDWDIGKLFHHVSPLLTYKPERLRAMVACTQGLGVPRGSWMFIPALLAVACVGKERIAAKVEFLKKTCRWSDAEVGIAVSKHPSVLKRSKDMLQRSSEFLISEVGLEPAYIAHRPVMLSLCLEGRLRPRYYVLKFLKENGLLQCNWSYNTAVKRGSARNIQICTNQEQAMKIGYCVWHNKVFTLCSNLDGDDASREDQSQAARQARHHQNLRGDFEPLGANGS